MTDDRARQRNPFLLPSPWSVAPDASSRGNGASCECRVAHEARAAAPCSALQSNLD
jgi:hypothetical protein